MEVFVLVMQEVDLDSGYCTSKTSYVAGLFQNEDDAWFAMNVEEHATYGAFYGIVKSFKVGELKDHEAKVKVYKEYISE